MNPKNTMKFNKKYQAFVALVGVTAVAGAFAAQSVTPSATSTKNFNGKKRGGMHKELTEAEKTEHKDTLATSLAVALGATKESVLASLASGKTPQDIIKASGLDEKTVEAKLQASHLAELKAKLAIDVTAGKLTQAEADKKLAEISSRPNHPNAMMGMGLKGGNSDQMIADTATILGTTKEAIQTQITAGKKFQEIATASGISEADFRTKMQALQTARLKTALSVEVTSGKLTQAEADKKLAEIGNRMNKKGNENFKDGFMKKGMHSHSSTTNATTTR